MKYFLIQWLLPLVIGGVGGVGIGWLLWIRRKR